jgi:hypothetical protein
MYGHGTATGAVLAAATTSVVLPLTGMSNIIQIAIATASGLAVWGVIYIFTAKFKVR